MRHKEKILISTLAISLVLVVGLAWADGIKKRMLDRLPAISALKAKGILGENNKGYLEFIKGKNGPKNLVKAENYDRKKIYHAIAKKQGTTAELVGQRRAMKIAQTANAGEWIQSESGKWRQKK
ncbi:MAG: YdbL family protein [Desulfobacteraceae bacterium]|nr:YdbL family protein [Desulfobacteraceae bacterium]